MSGSVVPLGEQGGARGQCAVGLSQGPGPGQKRGLLWHWSPEVSGSLHHPSTSQNGGPFWTVPYKVYLSTLPDPHPVTAQPPPEIHVVGILAL